MRLGVALLLLTPALAGCLGASDDVGEPSTAEDAFQALCPAPCERVLLNESRDEFEPSVAVNPSDPDNILVGAYEVGGEGPFLSVVVSLDGGTSWTRAPLPPGSAADPGSQWRLFCGTADPVVFFGPDGTAYLVGLGLGCEEDSYIFLATSQDGGLTWGEPSIVWEAPTFYMQFQDKPWAAIDPATGNLVVSWSAFGAFFQTQELLVSVSTDGGTSWSTPPSLVATSLPMPVPGIEHEPWFYNYFSMPAWGTDGALHVAFRGCEGLCFKVATSPDLGGTWKTAEAARIELADREGARYVGTSAVLGVDRSGGEHHGRIYLSYADAGGGDYDVVVRWSDDGARTWSLPIRLNTNSAGDGTDQFQNWMAIDEHGVVHGFFLDRRNDPDNLLVQATYARYDPSTGNLFNEHLSAAWHPDPTDTGRPWYGDYEGVDALGGTVALAWTHVTDEPGQTTDPRPESVCGDTDPPCGDQDIHMAILDDRVLWDDGETGVAP